MKNFYVWLFLCFSLNLTAQIEQLNLKPLTSTDDAEENISTGRVSVTSSDLELSGYDGSTKQIVGIRFPNVVLPVGATIINAHIQFSVDETGTQGGNISIKAQEGNAATFATSTRNITNRNYTSSTVIWDVPTWNTLRQRGENQRTPDLSGIITEALLSGFTSGSALAFTFSTDQNFGKITAESVNSGNATAPELIIQYSERPIERKLLNDILVINEVTGAGTPENSNDWVELYNTGSEAINLDSVFITDDINEPSKFMFSQRNINGNSFVLVETDDYFGIKSGGETVYLMQTFNGTTILLDSLEGTDTSSKVSFGRKPDGSESITTFNRSTPGSSNNSALKFIDLNFSQERGLYKTGFALSLSAPGATIRYTTNSSIPSANSGTLYSGPIQINSNTVIKAYAYSDIGESKVITSTYIINSDPAYEKVPVLSVSTTNSLSSQSENDCTVEYIDKYGEGSSAFADAGFRVFGATSTGLGKKSYRFKFRKKYGYSKFDHPIFEQKDDENYAPVKSFNSFDIRSSHDATASGGLGGTNMSSNIAHNYLRQMGNVNVHTRHVHVFMNGSYHGVYTLKEHYSASYAEDYFGGDKTEYDRLDGTSVITSWDDTPSVSDGSINQWNELKSFATNDFQEIKARMDINHFIDFMLMHFIGGFEWEYRAIAHKGLERTKFRFHHNDFDGFIRENPSGLADYLGKLSTSSGEGPGRLFYLAGFGGSNLEYMTMVKDRVLTLFNENSPEGVMTVSNFTAKTNEFREAYREYNQLEYDRWGYSDSTQYKRRVNGYLNYLPTRFQRVRSFLDGRGLLHTHDYVTMSQPEGRITANQSVTIANPNRGTTVYYTLDGRDVVFDNAIAPWAVEYRGGSLPLKEGENTVKARAYSNGNFGPLTEITYDVASTLNITGINYHPKEDDGQEEGDLEFLLVTNNGTGARTVAGDSIKGINFVFPAGSVINAGETVMIAKSDDIYPSLTFPRISWADGTLSNKGEKLTFKKSDGQIINSLEYDDKSPWPVEADGDGYYLKLKQNDLDNSIASNWESVKLPATIDPCIAKGGDADGDGVCALDDCDDNNPNISSAGDLCDDLDNSTENDRIQDDCSCLGSEILDCPILGVNIGDNCNDNDDTTENDEVQDDCTCIGTSIYDCPDLNADIGDSCNDNDANTENDVVLANCSCAGTPITTETINITGINYNPLVDEALDEENFEFLLVTNYGTSAESVSGDSIKGIDFVFPEEMIIESGETVMLTKNMSSYPGLEYRRFLFTGKLSNKGERLLFKKTNNGVINDLTYDDNGDWPEEADGGGYYLQLKESDLDNTIGANWDIIPLPLLFGACTDQGGDADNDGVCGDQDCDDNNPDVSFIGDACDDGDDNTENDEMIGECLCAGTPIVSQTLNITGINYNPSVEAPLDEENFEFLLVTNYGTQPESVSGDTIKGAGFVFPEGTIIDAGETVMLTKDLNSYPSLEYRRFLLLGKLSNKGEQLLFKRPDNGVINDLTYDDKDEWPEEADGGGYYLQLEESDVDNSIAANWDIVPLPELLPEEVCPTPGTSCDDSDPSTENDMEDGNCNCVGTACPTAGTSCDDGDASTENDIEDGNCGCAGTACPTAGTSCDDGDASTENDIEDGNCGCAGTACPEAGTSCDDGDASTENDIEDGNCGCAGTACPEAGTSCDDGDASTENDIEDGNCGCAGTLIPIIDCVLSDWSEWSICDSDCGEGIEVRTRTILVEAQNGGLACGPLTESRVCNNEPCMDEEEGCFLFDSSDFGQSWGIWIDGGSDSYRIARDSRVRLRDNSGVRSSMYTRPIDFSDADQIRISFAYRPISMEDGEDFILEYSTDGNEGYTEIQSWVSGQDFQNNQNYQETVIIEESFSETTRFRIRCDASSNGDMVFIQDVEIEECIGEEATTPEPVDCIVSEWSEWSECDAECGGGTRTRTRSIIRAAAFGGSECPVLSETEACNTQACPSEGDCTTELVLSNDFEIGFGNWNDGGADCYRAYTTLLGGNRAMRLRDNSSSSILFSNSLDLTGKSSATISFRFITMNFINGEDFFLEYKTDGGEWIVMEQWVMGSDFNNEIIYDWNKTYGGYAFTGDTQFRFRCDASSNRDKLYMDDLVIEKGCEMTSNLKGSLTKARNLSSSEVLEIENAHTEIESIEALELSVNPNPARDFINLEFSRDLTSDVTVAIFNVQGQQISHRVIRAHDSSDAFRIETSEYRNGAYFIRVSDAEGYSDMKRIMIVK